MNSSVNAKKNNKLNIYLIKHRYSVAGKDSIIKEDSDINPTW